MANGHGGARIGAGRRRKPVELKLLSGTYRRDRATEFEVARLALGSAAGQDGITDGSYALAQPALTPPGAMIVPPPAWVLTGLRRAGLARVRGLWAAAEDWSPLDCQVLHEIGLTVDELVDYEKALATGPLVIRRAGAEVPNPLLWHARQARASLLKLIARLGLKG
jgi:hypothetical protein